MTCSYVYKKDEVHAYVFEIHKSRDTDDIFNKVLQWLRSNFEYAGPDNEVEIYHKSDKLQLGKSLKEVSIQEDTNLRIVLSKVKPIPDC